MTDIAIKSIKFWEKCKLKAYKDGGGVWTCGWGSTGHDVIEGTEWTQEEADGRLKEHCRNMEGKIRASLKFPDLLSDNQMAAICSWTYNIGNSAEAHSTLIRKLNLISPLVADEWQWLEIGNMFLKWDVDNGVHVPGLANRRLAERELFLS